MTHHDIKKLPKWAQKEIQELIENQNKQEYGANISGCHIENNAIKHDENTVEAIKAVASAMSDHSKALHELAKSVSGSGVNVEFGNGIHLSDIRHS